MSLTKKKWETYQYGQIFQLIRGVHSILLYNLSEVYSIQHNVIKFVSDLHTSPVGQLAETFSLP
jgi:hypothetical protein